MTGASLHVLFVCSRDQWRSPTGERVWRSHPVVLARSAGTSEGARHPVSRADIREPVAALPGVAAP